MQFPAKGIPAQSQAGPRHLRRGVVGWLVIIFALVGIIAVGTGERTGKGSVEAVRRDIVQEKDFLAANPKYLDGVRSYITSSGFGCPRILHLWADNSSLGAKLEAFCDSKDQNATHYAVYPERHMAVAWSNAEGVEKRQASSNKDSDSDIDDLVKNRKFNAENPKYLGAIRTLITGNGYDCPRLAHLWFAPDNPTPYGTKLEALCGPVGTTNAYTALHYSVFPDHLKVVVCKPFGILGGGCD